MPRVAEPESGAFLDIGEVVRRSGVKPSTLHVWERHELITPTGRLGLRRQYDPAVLDRIAVIVVCQRAGFTLDEIAEFFGSEAEPLRRERLQAKLAELVEHRQRLDRAIDGLQHALSCPEPDPLACDGFRRKLEGVLPVRAARASTKAPPRTPR